MFGNSDVRYEKPYELFMVTKEGVREKIDIFSHLNFKSTYDVESCHRIDVEFQMISDFNNL